ncbi:hypothetical protein D3C72_1390340 [compost metagenome]
MRSGTRCQACSAQLGLHAATTQRTTGTTGHGIQARIIGTGFVDQLRIRVVARVGIEHAVAVGEDHQQVGFDQVGDQRGQGVVVTETDFVGDHRVVLVDYRHDAQLDQGAQGAARIEVTLAVGQVIVGQENLRRVPAMLGKARLPGLHQAHLAD